ncbi:maleylpyruvate isomerase family mycothiol-dependent enzyme [Actinomadura harenae]|uniref:Maleylpyruvate isomerase family mycothiol-dependent enzyme n=1 Tax=Actinomadura harenae TaxID=2483351 RepID=A0A3M2LHD1_9ACTN|nr:maleylpyruvate isomerase family mycothiol-dependent enzyme [Actinomadura harenae]RMI36831.1 maleylpyruvate isomerase family mycothiol-dependent enzyme [Actinomadura harenae]
MWTHERYCDAVEREVAAFTAALEDADPAAPVPSCPGWAVRDLAGHLGVTQRWAEGLVRTRATRPISPRRLAGPIPETDAELRPWFAEGGAALVATLRAADPGMEMWAWGGDQHARFWSRRMVHEAVVHRADLHFALGRGCTVSGEAAVDGMDELLGNLPYAATFAPKVENLRGDGSTLAFTADDTGDRWTVGLEKDRFEWRRSSAADDVHADASVRADASALFLFLWGRRKTGDPGISVAGDRDLVAFWAENSAI